MLNRREKVQHVITMSPDKFSLSTKQACVQALICNKVQPSDEFSNKIFVHVSTSKGCGMKEEGMHRDNYVNSIIIGNYKVFSKGMPFPSLQDRFPTLYTHTLVLAGKRFSYQSLSVHKECTTLTVYGVVVYKPLTMHCKILINGFPGTCTYTCSH